MKNKNKKSPKFKTDPAEEKILVLDRVCPGIDIVQGSVRLPIQIF